MILPNKHVKISGCILGTGAILLKELSGERTVSSLWESVRDKPEIRTFGKFVLSLDLLFVLGLVRYNKRGFVELSKK